MAEPPTFGRYTELPYEQMRPEQQASSRTLLETRGRLPGPHQIDVHNPKLAKVMGSLGAHCRTGYALSERESAGCIITSKLHAAYPTNAPERAATAAGRPPAFANPRAQVVYEMATGRAHTRWVSRGLSEHAVAALGHVGLTDVLTLLGFDARVAMTLAVYDVLAGATGMARSAATTPARGPHAPRLGGRVPLTNGAWRSRITRWDSPWGGVATFIISLCQQKCV